VTFGLFLLPEHNATNHFAATNIVFITKSVCWMYCVVLYLYTSITCSCLSFQDFFKLWRYVFPKSLLFKYQRDF